MKGCDPAALQLVTKPEQHLRQEYVPLHQRVGLEQKRRTTKMAQAQMRKVKGAWPLLALVRGVHRLIFGSFVPCRIWGKLTSPSSHS
jgi:hypothetical protein